MPQPRRASGWEHAALAAGAAALAAATASRKLGDFDLPWHLAFGRLVVQRGTLPRVDDLAYTQRPIEYAEFIADLVLYGVVHLAGPAGLQILGGLLAAALLLLLARAPNRQQSVGTMVGCAAIASTSAWLIVRPATFSFVLVALTMLLLQVHRDKPATRRGRMALGALVPLHILWANLHGFVVVGVATMLAYAGHRVLCRLARGRLGPWLPLADGEDAWVTVASTAAAVGGTMLNAAGPLLLLGPLRALPDTARVTEWAPTTLRFLVFDEPAALLYALFALALCAFGRDPQTRSRVPPLFDATILLMALMLGSSAVRLLAIGAVLSAPVVGRRLAALAPDTRLLRSVSAATPMLLATWMLLRPGTSFGFGFEPFHFPEAAVQFVEQHEPQGHMWNSLPYGGYLAWRLYPEHRVLIDGRTGWVHEPEVVSLAHLSERNEAAFETLVQRFAMQWAVCRAVEGEPFGIPLASSNGWTMVFWDDVSAVYVRRDGPNAQLARDGYRFLRHLTPMAAVLQASVQADRVEDLVHDAALAVQQDGASPRAAFLQACAALALRDAAAFREAAFRLRSLSTNPQPAAVVERAWDSVTRRAP